MKLELFVVDEGLVLGVIVCMSADTSVLDLVEVDPSMTGSSDLFVLIAVVCEVE